MKSYWKKLLLSLFFFVLYGSILIPAGLAQQTASVSLPTFKITMNNVSIDNNDRLYPIIVYKDITYVPMTYSDSRFLGLETKWNSSDGLQVNKVGVTTTYNPDRGYFNRTLENAYLPEFRIRVNGQEVYNGNETYPLLLFRDITYFPLTWRFMVDEFGWTSSFDAVNGLIINSKGSEISYPTTPPAYEANQVFSKDFGSIRVIFDRSNNNQPGNLFVRENNVTRRIGNPNYIYGVGYMQAGNYGTYGEYTAVNSVEYANRWVYTLAIDPSISPAVARNVRINIDTNEVQTTDSGTIGEPSGLSDKVYSKQFNNITIMLDRSSNQQPGNLYVRENNVTRRIGNPNYIYGVSYYKVGRYGSYNSVDTLDLRKRWVYTIAIDTTTSTLISRNVRVNIDTNEVQMTDSGTIAEPITLSDNVYSKQFNNITVMLDRSSNQQAGNLYVRENNIIRRIGNPNYIYGVSYYKVGPFGTYNPVNNLDLRNRWVYALAIDTTKSTLTSRNARINIDTNEVRFL